MLLSAQNANSGESQRSGKWFINIWTPGNTVILKRWRDVFTPDADQLVSSGEWRRGRDAVVRGTLASSVSTGGHRSITIQTIRMLSPTVALADGPYELTGLAGAQDRKMWTTFLLTRGSVGWRIAAIRNMLPAKPEPRK